MGGSCAPNIVPALGIESNRNLSIAISDSHFKAAFTSSGLLAAAAALMPAGIGGPSVKRTPLSYQDLTIQLPSLSLIRVPLSYHESTIVVATARRKLVLCKHGHWRVDSPKAFVAAQHKSRSVRMVSSVGSTQVPQSRHTTMRRASQAASTAVRYVAPRGCLTHLASGSTVAAPREMWGEGLASASRRCCH